MGRNHFRATASFTNLAKPLTHSIYMTFIYAGLTNNKVKT